jgi:hypothetical protein
VPVELDLELVRDNAAFEAREVLGAFDAARRIEVRAAAVDSLGILYRRIAICHLLADADTQEFLRWLHASGRALAALLTNVRWADVVDRYYLCASRPRGFFDALAAGDLATAAEIGRLAPRELADGDEDEDDFAWARAMMAAVGDGRSASPDAAEWSERLAAAAGADDPRVAVCRALLAGPRSGDAFERGMAALVARRSEEIDALRGSPSAAPAELATEGHVHVEGVAACRLARIRGVPVGGPHPLVPGAAWAHDLASAPPPDGWRHPPPA